MSSLKRGKFERITQQQLQYYMKFCKQHPEITRLKEESGDKSDSSQIYELWAQLVDNLNEMRGPTRTVKRWKETLAHWKNQVRSRTLRYRQQSGRNGITSTNCPKSEHEMPVTQENIEISEAQKQRPKSTAIAHQLSEVKFKQKNDGDVNSGDDDSSISSTSIPSSVPHIMRSHRRTIKSGRSIKAPKLSYADICSTIVKSLEARREREELLYINQESVISKLDQTLTLMTRVLEKIDRRLDKI